MSRKRKPNYFIPVAVIAGVGLAIYTSNKPWKVYQQEKVKASEMRTDMDTLQRSNAKLREKDQPLNPVQKEEEARRMGYGLPNETPVVLKPGQAPTEKPEQPKPKKEVAAPPIDLREEEKSNDTQPGAQ